MTLPTATLALLAGLAAACGTTMTAGPGAPAGAKNDATGTCRTEAPAPCAAAPPSFADDVQPILEKRCFRCHTGDGPAAEEHDFSKMDRVLGQRRAIREEIATCAMPPKAPLAEAEANTLLRWATCAQSAR